MGDFRLPFDSLLEILETRFLEEHAVGRARWNRVAACLIGLLAASDAPGGEPQGGKDGVELSAKIDIIGIEVVETIKLDVLFKTLSEWTATDVASRNRTAIRSYSCNYRLTTRSSSLLKNTSGIILIAVG